MNQVPARYLATSPRHRPHPSNQQTPQSRPLIPPIPPAKLFMVSVLGPGAWAGWPRACSRAHGLGPGAWAGGPRGRVLQPRAGAGGPGPGLGPGALGPRGAGPGPELSFWTQYDGEWRCCSAQPPTSEASRAAYAAPWGPWSAEGFNPRAEHFLYMILLSILLKLFAWHPGANP